MTISFVCVCQTPYTAEDYQAGQQFTCPTCHQVVVIPGVPAAPAPSPAPAPQVSQNQQGWAGNFFEGKAEPTKSRGAQMLAELDATSDAAMDDELLGRNRQKSTPAPAPAVAPAVPAPAVPAPAAPAPAIQEEMQLLPDSDIATAPAGMDAAMDEVANLFENAPKTSSSQKRRPSNTSSERPRTKKGSRRPTDQSASRKRRRPNDQNKESNRGRRKSKSTRAPAPPAGNPHITDCTVCGEQISRKARECPYCQAPVPRDPSFAEKNEQLLQYAKLGGGILALLILLGVAFKLMGGSGDTRKRRRSKKSVDVVNTDDTEKKEETKDPEKKVEEDKDKDKPKKDPGKKRDPIKVDPSKKDPLGAFTKILEPLRKATDPKEVETQIAELAKNSQAKEICQAVIKVERDSILAGYCYRALYAATKGPDRAAFLRRGLNANALDATFAAVDIVLAENNETFKKQALSGRLSGASGRRFAALYTLALLEAENDGPKAKDLRTRALVMDGQSSSVRPRVAVLRLLAGDGLVIEDALKAFDFDHPRLRQTAQRAFEQYSGKDDIVLADPGDASAAQETKEKWAAWYESYKPFLEPLAHAVTDPNAINANSGEREKLQVAARKLRHSGIVTLLGYKDKPLISYMRTFAKAQASAKTKQGHRTLALIMEQVATEDEFPLIFRWLDEIKTVNDGAEFYAAAALSAAGKDAVPAVLRLMERGVLKAKQVARFMPDLGRVRCDELTNLEVKMVEIKAGNQQDAEPYWYILASLGSKLCEEYLTDKKRSEATAIGVMARYNDKKFEKRLFKAAIGEEKIPNLDPAQAARYLALAGSTNSSKAALGLLKEPKHANIANQLILGLATPKYKKQLFDGLKSSNGSLATVCIRALIDMNLTDRGTASKYASIFNKSDCPHYLKVHLKNALIAMRVTGKKQPRAELIKQTDQWRANYKRWEKTKSGLPPTLPAAVIEGLGRVGDKKDTQILLDALAATQSNADREKILTALGHLKAKEGAFSMRGYLLPNRRARGIAALALAQIKEKSALGELKFVLTDSKGLTGDDGQVFMAISLIDPVEAWTVYKLVKEKKIKMGGDAFAGIAFALAREPEAEGLGELQTLINDPDPKARAGIGYGIALALAHKRVEVSPGLEDFLKPLLFDEAPEVRINTLLALLALKADFVKSYIYSVVREDSQHFQKPRSDAFSEFLEPEYTKENFEQWVFRLAKKSAGFRRYLSKGIQREIRESFRK